MLIYCLYAKSDTEKTGDALSVIIPLSAYGSSLYLKDNEGQKQFYKSYFASLAMVYPLKYSINERRPDGSSNDSFPSGHTASAFAGATFIYKRYGIKYSLLPYIGAIYTGYSRVYAKKHYLKDVVAGAFIGVISNLYFVTSYKNLQIIPIFSGAYNGVEMSYIW
jgi:membrane-associated phospholipid phosphatase